jgi:hypothetical protein
VSHGGQDNRLGNYSALLCQADLQIRASKMYVEAIRRPLDAPKLDWALQLHEHLEQTCIEKDISNLVISAQPQPAAQHTVPETAALSPTVIASRSFALFGHSRRGTLSAQTSHPFYAP